MAKNPSNETPARTRSIQSLRSRKKNRPKWVTLLVAAFTVATLVICTLWVTAFKFYNVVSNSMAPTLHGSEYDRDRLLCWMLSFPGRLPRRWEMVLFDTPEVGRNRQIVPGMDTGGQRGITVKRVVGIPGERLAIADGDIWTHGPRDPQYIRRNKPDPIQRSLWISVYREDFEDITLEEFGHHWAPSGNGAMEITGRTLAMVPLDPAGCGLRYKPVVRVGGSGGKSLAVLPGIPDRYVLDQEVLFTCRKTDCATAYAVMVDNQKIQARCPVCKTMNYEDAVSFYGFRSGLAEIGPYAVGYVPQSDTQHNRANSYFFVPDLRVRLSFRLPSTNAAFAIALQQAETEDILRIAPDGVSINGEPVRSAPAIVPGAWMEVEFYRADGALRLFFGGSTQSVFDKLIHMDEKPAGQESGLTSGIAIRAEGEGVLIDNIAIDRDIYYFSGSDQAIGGYLSGMEPTGEITIPEDAFFPMGDNTTVSLDARSWGPVPLDLLKGTALRVWRPAERARAIPMPAD